MVDSAAGNTGKGADLAAVVHGLQALVGDVAPGVTETVNSWGVPTFVFDGPMCYYSVAMNHVTFGFLRGTSLPDPHGLLEGTGKAMRHVKLRSVADLQRRGLRELIAAAAELNRAEPRQEMPKGKA